MAEEPAGVDEITLGVHYSPEEFVKAAALLDHPFESFAAAATLAGSIRFRMTSSVDAVVQHRRRVLDLVPAGRNRCTCGRSELAGVPDVTVDISRKKRTQPDAKKDGPVPGQKGNQLAAENVTTRIKKNADSVSNPNPRSNSICCLSYKEPQLSFSKTK